jgi:hypothetical protein
MIIKAIDVLRAQEKLPSGWAVENETFDNGPAFMKYIKNWKDIDKLVKKFKLEPDNVEDGIETAKQIEEAGEDGEDSGFRGNVDGKEVFILFMSKESGWYVAIEKKYKNSIPTLKKINEALK